MKIGYVDEIPSVDPEKIRWKCRPPYSTPVPLGLFGGLADGIMDRFAENSQFAARMEAYFDAQISKPGVNTITPGVGHNVNVVTDRVPPHIAALPEEEQGPALVEAIFERKRRAQK